MKPRKYQKSPEQKEPKQKFYSYLIPYLVIEDITEDGTPSEPYYMALIGQKKGVNPRTVEKINKHQSINPNERCERLLSNVISKKFDWERDSRFHGLFYAGMGRPTCFGGQVERSDRGYKRAAAREFLEETGIIHLISTSMKENLIKEISESSFLIYKSPNFNGRYHAVDASRCPTLMPFLLHEKIVQQNEKILKDEIIYEKEFLRGNKINEKFTKNISEMHQIEWVAMSEVDKILATKSDETTTYITNEIKNGAYFLASKIYNPKTEKDKFNALKNALHNFIETRIADEVINSNIDAAKKLQNLLLNNAEELINEEEEQLTSKLENFSLYATKNASNEPESPKKSENEEFDEDKKSSLKT